MLFGAGDRSRTDDNHVGNVALCQLSYTRIKILVENTKSFGPGQGNIGHPRFTVALYWSSKHGANLPHSKTYWTVNPRSIPPAHIMFITLFSPLLSEKRLLVLSKCLYALCFLLMPLFNAYDHVTSKTPIGVIKIHCSTISNCC